MKQEEFICSKHFKDRSIKDYIINNAIAQRCKYCEKIKQVVSITDLAGHIEEIIGYEYDDPYSRGAYYDKEAEYYEDRFPHTYSQTRETIDVLEDELDADPWQVLGDLAAAFSNGYWSKIDGIWGPTQDQYLIGGWDDFKELLKHKVRFLFFNESLKHDFNDRHGESSNPYIILEEVHKAIDKLDLYKVYPKGRLRVFRSRQHKKNEEVNSAFKLGSPPPSLAKANRMSPAGISMFYGALDVETCESEIEDPTWTNSRITTGKFSNLKQLTLIDFTKLKTVPSIFDTHRDKRKTAKFLLRFIADLSIPVRPDEKVHIDYIPTQVVTEYIKIILGRKKNVDGIIYNSVKNQNGRCVVLFVQNDDICNETDFSIGDKQILVLDNQKFFTRDIK